MAKAIKTSNKRPPKPFKGAVDGKPFTTDNQPSPEAKKAGWEQWRKERHLTQSIIKEMLGTDGKPTDTFKDFIAALVGNAKAGNPKAIDVVTRCIEDDILKVAHTDGEGNDLPIQFIFQQAPNCKQIDDSIPTTE